MTYNEKVTVAYLVRLLRANPGSISVEERVAMFLDLLLKGLYEECL